VIPFIKIHNVLHDYLQYSKGLAKASVHSALLNSPELLYEDQNVDVLTKVQISPVSVERLDVWVSNKIKVRH
jgi:hypothetical protein